jgi:hypothetical protein
MMAIEPGRSRPMRVNKIVIYAEGEPKPIVLYPQDSEVVASVYVPRPKILIAEILPVDISLRFRVDRGANLVGRLYRNGRKADIDKEILDGDNDLWKAEL